MDTYHFGGVGEAVARDVSNLVVGAFVDGGFSVLPIEVVDAGVGRIQPAPEGPLYYLVQWDTGTYWIEEPQTLWVVSDSNEVHLGRSLSERAHVERGDAGTLLDVAWSGSDGGDIRYSFPSAVVACRAPVPTEPTTNVRCAALDGDAGTCPPRPNIMLTIDKSGSMLIETDGGTRLGELKSAMNALLTQHGNMARFGLTLFPDTDDASSCTAACLPGTVVQPIPSTQDVDAELWAGAQRSGSRRLHPARHRRDSELRRQRAGSGHVHLQHRQLQWRVLSDLQLPRPGRGSERPIAPRARNPNHRRRLRPRCRRPARGDTPERDGGGGRNGRCLPGRDGCRVRGEQRV